MERSVDHHQAIRAGNVRRRGFESVAHNGKEHEEETERRRTSRSSTGRRNLFAEQVLARMMLANFMRHPPTVVICGLLCRPFNGGHALFKVQRGVFLAREATNRVVSHHQHGLGVLGDKFFR